MLEFICDHMTDAGTIQLFIIEITNRQLRWPKILMGVVVRNANGIYALPIDWTYLQRIY